MLNRTLRTTASLTIAAATLALGGCLISSSNSTYETGRHVSDNTLLQIETGQTTEQWLIATLGQPTSQSEVEDQPGVEILRYDYSEHKESDGSLFLIFSGSSRKSHTSTTYFEVTDGVVTNHWTD